MGFSDGASVIKAIFSRIVTREGGTTVLSEPPG